jgi:hypothetical protein
MEAQTKKQIKEIHHPSMEPEIERNSAEEIEVLTEKSEGKPEFISIPSSAPLKPAKAGFTAAILPWCC